jgi:hypothetical protein
MSSTSLLNTLQSRPFASSASVIHDYATKHMTESASKQYTFVTLSEMKATQVSRQQSPSNKKDG